MVYCLIFWYFFIRKTRIRRRFWIAPNISYNCIAEILTIIIIWSYFFILTIAPNRWLVYRFSRTTDVLLFVFVSISREGHTYFIHIVRKKIVVINKIFNIVYRYIGSNFQCMFMQISIKPCSDCSRTFDWILRARVKIFLHKMI